MIVLLFLFFLSGLIGIVYEVIWIRIFTDILGSSVQSVSAVTIAFLLGLGIGSYLFGKRVDESSRPLRFYALLEVGIGLTIVLNYWLFMHSGSMIIALSSYLDYHTVKWFSFLLAFIFISIPALFIGGTFPAISKSLIHDEANLEEKLGRLYSINTFGAGIGALLSGLILIKCLGFKSTLFLCAGINILIAIMVLVINQYRPVLELSLIHI